MHLENLKLELNNIWWIVTVFDSLDLFACSLVSYDKIQQTKQKTKSQMMKNKTLRCYVEYMYINISTAGSLPIFSDAPRKTADPQQTKWKDT